jgi:hypothetical protein
MLTTMRIRISRNKLTTRSRLLIVMTTVVAARIPQLLIAVVEDLTGLAFIELLKTLEQLNALLRLITFY